MIEVYEKSVKELREGLEKGEFTSKDLVLSYMERIARLDQCEGGLNSVLELNPDALAIAEKMDALRKKGKILSVLHGIPLLIKDNISTNDRMATSAGGLALKDNYAVEDAFLVKKLREQGVVLLGKANMTEYANYMSYNMPGGYSSRGGQVLSPYDVELNVGGSSSGSAVSVAASLTPVAIGTETSGSILYPASVSGIVGLKPTMGWVSRQGIIPISSTLDTAGPMGRTVEDVAALFTVMVGEDPLDPVTYNSKEVDFEQLLTHKTLKNLRFGIATTAELSSEYRVVQGELMGHIEQLGGEILEIPPVENPTEAGNIMNYEFRSAMTNYLVKFGSSKAKNLGDIIRINQDHMEQNLKYGQLRMMDAQNTASGCHTEPVYIDLLLRREAVIQNLTAEYERLNLDAIIVMNRSSLPPYTGFPGLTIPLALSEKGHPMGCCIIGKPFEDGKLLSIGHLLEQKIGGRVAPESCK